MFSASGRVLRYTVLMVPIRVAVSYTARTFHRVQGRPERVTYPMRASSRAVPSQLKPASNHREMRGTPKMTDRRPDWERKLRPFKRTVYVKCPTCGRLIGQIEEWSDTPGPTERVGGSPCNHCVARGPHV